jgi:hypothetical protein
MTDKDERLLLSQATKLAKLGLTVERERTKLKALVERGIPYDDPKMLQTLERFTQADAEWKQLEAEHIRLRERLGMEMISIAAGRWWS